MNERHERQQAAKPRGRTVWTTTALVLGATLGAFLWGRWNTTTTTETPVAPAAMLDSLEVANQRSDWEAALAWSQRLVESNPRDSGAWRRLAVAWHQYGGMDADSAGDTPARRTSLERIECERQVLAAADSALAHAANDQEWVNAVYIRARSMEYLGFPIDALEALIQIQKRRPDYTPAASGAELIRRRIVDPALDAERR